MSGLNKKRLIWTIVFLGITLAAIVMEVVAGVWHPAGTIPWTEYITQYVPWPVQLAAYVILAVWLPFHFWRADQKREAAYRKGVREGATKALKRAPADVARMFHEEYEGLAPDFGYRTREASAKPWEDVPGQNKALMTETAARVMHRLYRDAR